MSRSCPSCGSHSCDWSECYVREDWPQESAPNDIPASAAEAPGWPRVIGHWAEDGLTTVHSDPFKDIGEAA